MSVNGQKTSVAISNNIQSSVAEYKKLFLEKNYERLANLASPNLIKHLSSKEDLIFLFDSFDQEIQTRQVKIVDISFGDISKIYYEGKELQCSIPLEIKMENEKVYAYVYSSLALISLDDGDKWYFAFKVEEDDLINNEVLGLNKNIVLPARIQKKVQK